MSEGYINERKLQSEKELWLKVETLQANVTYELEQIAKAISKLEKRMDKFEEKVKKVEEEGKEATGEGE